MIRFEAEDSDPYTQIVIYEDDEVKSGSMVAFSLTKFTTWLESKNYPKTVKEAEDLLGEYDDEVKKEAETYHANILEEIRQEEVQSYSERYTSLKKSGYSEHEIHVKLFPEEYDFILDDYVDLNARNAGKNPMNEEYIATVNERRRLEGFAPLNSTGNAVNSQTMEWCKSHDK